MTERLSDERITELVELQQKRIKGRGGVPEVRDLATALAELAEYRQRDRVLATAASIAERNKELLDRLAGDEARREAESAARREIPETSLDALAVRTGYRRGFAAGAQWQAARDAERIEALDAEVERLRGQLDAADRQIEARTGETAGERLWKARVEQAEAMLARIRGVERGEPS